MAIIKPNNNTLSSITALPAADGSSLTGIPNDAVQIASASGGGTTTQVFNDCFSSTYEHYMILASIQPSATGQINLRLQNSSNVEIASNYYYSGRNAFQGSGSQGGSAIGVWGANQISPEFNVLGNPHAFYKIFVFKPFQSAKTVIDLRFHCQQNYSEQFNSSSVTGTLDETTICAGFRFVSTNGNINSTSSFRIYGFK
jgi:hypothetical protein